MTCRPTWYLPATTDHERLKSDKNDLVNLTDRISAALNGERPIEFELKEEQINRWLAARTELEPILGVGVELPGTTGPQVLLRDGNVGRLAATVSRRGVSLVLSADVRPELEDGELRLHIEAVRAGNLPLPRRLALRPLRESFRSANDGGSVMDGHTVRLVNEWRWPNGKRWFRITRLAVSRGVARVTLEPLRGGP